MEDFFGCFHVEDFFYSPITQRDIQFLIDNSICNTIMKFKNAFRNFGIQYENYISVLHY